MEKFIITPEVYTAIAKEFASKICDGALHTTDLEVEVDKTEHRFVTTFVCYFDENNSELTDIIPVWWEIKTYQEYNRLDNDFDFETFKGYAIEQYNAPKETNQAKEFFDVLANALAPTF